MRSVSRFHGVLAFTVLTSVAVVAHASPEGDVATAETAYATLDYPAAAASAEQVLNSRGLNHDVLTRATRVAALSHAALGHGEKAKEYFVLLLQYEPDYKLDTKLGPRFSEPYSEARGYWHAQGRKPSMDVQAVMQHAQAGQIRVTTVDPNNTVKRIAIGYRWAPAAYTTVTVEPGTRTVEVPASPKGSGRLDYYVRAADAKDNAVFEDGTVDAPKSVMVNEPSRAGAVQEEKKSFFGSPVFLAITGVVVAGAAVGAYFAFRPTEYTPGNVGRGVVGVNCGTARCE